MSDSGPPYGGEDPGVGRDVKVDPARVEEEAFWLLGLDVLSPKTRRRLTAAVGIGALGLAILLVAAPWLPVWLAGPFLPLLLLAEAGKEGVIVVGLVGALVGVWSLFAKTAGGRERPPEIELPVRLEDRRRGHEQSDGPGERLNTLVERVSGDAEDPSTGVNRTVDKRQVRKELRDVAVEVMADHHDVPEEEARTAVDEGTWTRSRRAATLLGDTGAPGPRLGTRIRDWASGDPFERRVHAAVDEITRTARIPVESDLLSVPIDPVQTGGPAREIPATAGGSGESDVPDLRLDRLGEDGIDLDLPDPEPETTSPVDERGSDDRSTTGETSVDRGRSDAGDATTDGADSATPADRGSTDGSARAADEELPEGWIAPDDGPEDAELEDVDGGEST